MPSGRGSSLPVSPFAPLITNVKDNSWVSQKALFVEGTIGDPSQLFLEGTVTVSRCDGRIPPISYKVHDSRFKALLYLTTGPNYLRFKYSPPNIHVSDSSSRNHTSELLVHMMPSDGAPPLQLAILLAKDSPGTFDAVPARIEREGNDLEIAVRKFRMAAYLWQAFTAEQMWRNRFGRRSFRFEEEWTTGAATHSDWEDGTFRSEARVHIIRTEKTVAELRDSDAGGLYGITADAVRNYFKPLPGQKLYVSALLLDSHWDTTSKKIVGHAACGGQVGDLHLAIFGSHYLQSYPTNFDEIVPALTDCTPTDTNHVSNDGNNAGSSWEAANRGIGAHLHEVGHLLGLPHQESGVMSRDYANLSRFFLTREAFSTRTRSRGGPVSHESECTWHRLDCLRFRSHPCFRIPGNTPAELDRSIQGWPLDEGCLEVTAPSGVAYVEIFSEGDDVCRTWIEYQPKRGGRMESVVSLTDTDLRSRLPEDKRKGRLRISVKSCGGDSLDIDDFTKLCSKESAHVKIPSSKWDLQEKVIKPRVAFRGVRLGSSQMEGSEDQEFVFASTIRHQKPVTLMRIVFYHGKEAVHGIEFVYSDKSRQLLGNKGGREGGDVFNLDIPHCEYITGFFVRSGAWIDAIQVLTSSGRKSPWFGNPYGGSPHTLIPPPNYTICGVAGSCGAWLEGFSVLITK